MSSERSPMSDWDHRTAQNTRRLALWTAAWVLTMAIATFGHKFLWDGNKSLTLLAILVNLAIGVGMIVANKHYLNGLDEMQRQVQLEAMAVALGVGLIVGLSYGTLADTGLIPFEAKISHLVILLSLTYMAALVRGLSKYR